MDVVDGDKRRIRESRGTGRDENNSGQRTVMKEFHDGRRRD